MIRKIDFAEDLLPGLEAEARRLKTSLSGLVNMMLTGRVEAVCGPGSARAKTEHGSPDGTAIDPAHIRSQSGPDPAPVEPQSGPEGLAEEPGETIEGEEILASASSPFGREGGASASASSLPPTQKLQTSVDNSPGRGSGHLSVAELARALGVLAAARRLSPGLVEQAQADLAAENTAPVGGGQDGQNTLQPVESEDAGLGGEQASEDWDRCPDGQGHLLDGGGWCKRCGERVLGQHELTPERLSRFERWPGPDPEGGDQSSGRKPLETKAVEIGPPIEGAGPGTSSPENDRKSLEAKTEGPGTRGPTWPFPAGTKAQVSACPKLEFGAYREQGIVQLPIVLGEPVEELLCPHRHATERAARACAKRMIEKGEWGPGDKPKEESAVLPPLPEDLAAFPGMPEAWAVRLAERAEAKVKLKPTQVLAQFQQLRRVAKAHGDRGPAAAVACVEDATASAWQGVAFPEDMDPQGRRATAGSKAARSSPKIQGWNPGPKNYGPEETLFDIIHASGVIDARR